MSEAKPLDWKDIEKKIEELVFEVNQVIDWRIEPKGEWDADMIKDIVRRDVKIFSRVDYAVELQDVEKLIQEIKQRIKEAVQGLIQEIKRMEFEHEHDKESNIYIFLTKRKIIDLINKRFADVFEEKKNEE